MKKITHILFFLACFSSAKAQQQDIKISVHPGIELITIIFKLSGRYPPSKPSLYEREVLAYFGKYNNLPAVEDLKHIKSKFIYTDLTELGFCYSDYPDFKLNIPVDSNTWYKNYGRETIITFLKHSADFAKQTRFLEFYKNHLPEFPVWGAKVRERLKTDSLNEKLYSFYRTNSKPTFYICLDPLNGWGNHATPNPEIYNPAYKNVKAYTLGYDPEVVDSTTAPVFAAGDYTTNLIWHEGGHVYLEPIFQKYHSSIDELAYLYNKNDEGMKRQLVNNWTYCLNENINRGVVLALFKLYKDYKAWRKQNAREILADFIYAEDISNFILTDYIGTNNYENFETYFPVLLKRLKSKLPSNTTTAVQLNQELADKLKQMTVTDQQAAGLPFPKEKYKGLNDENWLRFKDSIFRTHQKELEKIFDQYGYPGYDLVGKEGAFNFWLMVQHCDFNPAFQNKVLSKMRIQVEQGNAPADKYGWLTDRVNLNTGKKQLYGSQVTYNTATCQAYPKPLEDSINVNKRRAGLGMEPLEVYLNGLSEAHFEMNREHYLKIGIKEPSLYPVKQ